MRLHLDTDLGGDTDDACALAMILGWPGAEIVGITTSADSHGQRAGYVLDLLGLAGRDDIPVAAGAGVSLTTGEAMGDIPHHDTYWGYAVDPRPGPTDTALDLIDRSIDLGATIVAIGPYTNLALLERAQPGRLRATSIVVMGGWVGPSTEGLPAWGPETDWNIQCDTEAALTVTDQDHVTLVPLPVAMKTHLRGSHLLRLSASGPLGQLLARQASAHAAEFDMERMGRAYRDLPDDLLNFQYDPLTCAVALGWAGASILTLQLRPVLEDGILRFEADERGRQTRVVVDVDGDGFAETWLACVEAAQSDH